MFVNRLHDLSLGFQIVTTIVHSSKIDSENVHWKAQGEFWSKHKLHVFVGNCLMNLLLDPFWIHFDIFLAHLLGQNMSRGTPEAFQGTF